MGRSNLKNGETGDAFRNKLNTMFVELYDAISNIPPTDEVESAVWSSTNIAFTALQGGGETTKEITDLLLVPAGHEVIRAWVFVITPFAGGGEVTHMLGTTADDNKYSNSFDITVANDRKLKTNPDIEDFTNQTSLISKFTIGTGNVDTLTAGEITVAILTQKVLS